MALESCREEAQVLHISYTSQRVHQLVKQISHIPHVRMCTGVSSLCIHTISDGVVKRESIAEARASSMCLLID